MIFENPKRFYPVPIPPTAKLVLQTNMVNRKVFGPSQRSRRRIPIDVTCLLRYALACNKQHLTILLLQKLLYRLRNFDIGVRIEVWRIYDHNI